MKGIKTAVKTDWKNYVIGNSRGPIPIDKEPIYFKGFSVGDYLYASFHIKWKGVDWGEFKNSPAIIQFSGACGYAPLGFRSDSSEGETNVTRAPYQLADYSSLFGEKTTETTVNFLYTHADSNGPIKVADDGYIEITNIMVGKGTVVQPYIDSDELKAEGGGNK